MKRFVLCVATLTLVFSGAVQAHAGLITDLVGDKDGFGVAGAPAVPADGTLYVDDLGGDFITDYRDAGDLANAPFTDRWVFPGGFSYTHTYSLGTDTPVSATLDIQIAGIGSCCAPPFNVLFNTNTIGQFPDVSGVTDGFQKVILYSFNVPIAFLSSSDGIQVSGTGGDGYIINFSELKIVTVTNPSNPIPEPSTMLLLGSGLVGLVAWRKRKFQA